MTDCHALKMRAADGKMRKTDCATTEQLFPPPEARQASPLLPEVGKQ